MLDSIVEVKIKRDQPTHRKSWDFLESECSALLDIFQQEKEIDPSNSYVYDFRHWAHSQLFDLGYDIQELVDTYKVLLQGEPYPMTNPEDVK